MAKPGKRKGSNKFQFRRAAPNEFWVERKQLTALGLVVKSKVTQTQNMSDTRDAKSNQTTLSAKWDARLIPFLRRSSGGVMRWQVVNHEKAPTRLSASLAGNAIASIRKD